MRKSLFAVFVAALTVISFIPADAAGRVKKEKMDDLAARVFDVAGAQATLLASKLDDKSLPKTVTSAGKLVASDCNWWCSGFFPGTLWYIYDYTLDEKFAKLARIETEKLASVQYLKSTHDVGFMINCSYGNGLRIGDITEYQEVMYNAAHSLASRFNPVVGCIKSWGDDPRMGWYYPVIIDNMMNLELLVRVGEMYGEQDLIDMAKSHADVTIRNHFRDNYTTYHVVNYDPETGKVLHRMTRQGYSDESVWARGQAWGLYGYTMMAELTGEKRYLAQAEAMARWTIAHLPKDGVQYWDYTAAAKLLANEPGLDRNHAGELPDGSILRDASSAAITASAFVRLSELTGDRKLAKACRATAEKQVRALAGSEYLAEPGTNQGFLLKHSTGHYHGNGEVDAPLTYADYYFLEAVLRLINRL
jgi:Highly conserved protein containing a thioredoxin domain